MSEEERQRAGLEIAIKQQKELVEKAAAQALKELAGVLGEVHGQRYEVTQIAQASKDKLERLFALKTENVEVVFARTTHFFGTFGRGNDPLLKWPDARTQRVRHLPSPPSEFYPPYWLLYDDKGGRRSPSTFVRGVVVSSAARIDSKTWTYTLQLHGQSFDSFMEPAPSVLDGFDAVRDYWLRAGAAVFGVQL
jgi:hypothetical protein